DTSFFTQPEQLTHAYEGLWERAPVSLSVVPFHGRTRTKSIPAEYWAGEQQLYPVAENRPLVAFLREQQARNRVSPLLHGYSHVDEPDGYEFETGLDLERKAREGKQYLEGVLGTPVYAFAPPHNALSATGYRAVIHAGLDLVKIVSFRKVQRPWALRSVSNLIRVTWAQRVWKQPYPYVLDFGTHREVAAHSLTPSVSCQRLLRELEFCHRQRGVFVVATHYWECDTLTQDGVTLRQTLERLIARAHDLRAEFCSVNQVLRRK
ncbi:MAG: DUF2334 domain-containing protein, partial [Candidatus Binatia bacterium]